MSAKFVAEEGNLKGLELPFTDGESWIIGRDPEVCQLVIEDPSVSRKQLLCKKSELGLTIENLSETNKAFLNNQEISSPVLLKDSDFLKIGSGSYRFYDENDSPEEKEEEITTKNESEAESDLEADPNSSQDKKIEASENNPPESLPKENPLENLPKENIEEPFDNEDSIFEENSPSMSGLANINFDNLESGRFLLKVISGTNNGAEFSLQTNQSYLIGTDRTTCDIIFNDNSVSRQHVRLTVDPENKIFIEDLKSRNGTLIDGEPIEQKKALESNALITIGTTSFIIYDKESAMQTVISPLMPSIVRILQQKEEAKRAEEESKAKERERALLEAENKTSLKSDHHDKKSVNTFILISILAGLFAIAGIATTTLFKAEPVIKEESIQVESKLAAALSPFPSIKYNFNKNTGMLLLAGHVLTGTDKNQLLYNIQGLPFIKNIDDTGVVIDEFAWREINPTFVKNPDWRSVSIQSPSAGKFVLSGYLQTRKEADQLWDYVSNNFPYINLLEKKIVVEEDVISYVSSELLNQGLKDVTIQMNEGEVTLTGFIPTGKGAGLAQVIGIAKAIPGVRDVKNYVTEISGDQSMINLTDKYEVTGSSTSGKGILTVVINGKILNRGDILDGMLITSIKPNVILLEKDGIKYRIDYSK